MRGMGIIVATVGPMFGMKFSAKLAKVKIPTRGTFSVRSSRPTSIPSIADTSVLMMRYFFSRVSTFPTAPRRAGAYGSYPWSM